VQQVCMVCLHKQAMQHDYVQQRAEVVHTVSFVGTMCWDTEAMTSTAGAIVEVRCL